MKVLITLTACLLAGAAAAAPVTEADTQGLTLMVIYGVEAVEPHFAWTSEAKCRALVEAFQNETLLVEDEDLPRQKVKSIECRCACFDDETTELTQ